MRLTKKQGSRLPQRAEEVSRRHLRRGLFLRPRPVRLRSAGDAAHALAAPLSSICQKREDPPPSWAAGGQCGLFVINDAGAQAPPGTLTLTT